MTDTPHEDPASTPDEYLADKEAARKINGIFANRVFVQPTMDGMVRVNFGHIYDSEPIYHSAVVLTARDAVLFSELIDRLAQSVIPADPSTEATEPPPVVTG